MNENIDLTKILKDCPKGWKFYSSVYGEVEFQTIEFEQLIPIYNPNKFIDQGSLFGEDPHPIKFTAQDVKHSVSKAGEHINGKGECTFFPSKDQRDWSKFTAPWYKKEKFDPKTLKPFDKVLVKRYAGVWVANLFSHYGKIIHPGNHNTYLEFITISNGTYRHCIPYNDETKHLVGTNDEVPEYYRYWED